VTPPPGRGADPLLVGLEKRKGTIAVQEGDGRETHNRPRGAVPTYVKKKTCREEIEHLTGEKEKSSEKKKKKERPLSVIEKKHGLAGDDKIIVSVAPGENRR